MCTFILLIRTKNTVYRPEASLGPLSWARRAAAPDGGTGEGIRAEGSCTEVWELFLGAIPDKPSRVPGQEEVTDVGK